MFGFGKKNKKESETDKSDGKESGGFFKSIGDKISGAVDAVKEAFGASGENIKSSGDDIADMANSSVENSKKAAGGLKDDIK